MVVAVLSLQTCKDIVVISRWNVYIVSRIEHRFMCHFCEQL